MWVVGFLFHILVAICAEALKNLNYVSAEKLFEQMHV